MGNPWTTRFVSSSSSSSSIRSSSSGDEKKEEDGTKRKKKSKFLMDPAWTCFTFIKGVRIKCKEKLFQQNGGFFLQQVSYLRAKSFKIFTAKELEIATENYSVSRIVGQGGFGVVYKGTLPDNTTVAIKKSRIVNASHIEQYLNEIEILSQINHRNVVKLLGCCLEDQDLLLVYEFISNGTLYTHIHQTGHIQSISLQNRLRIAIEIAEAIAYLHSGASIQIFHRDIKPSNILLDDNLTAKVSDFGISRLVPIDQTQLEVTCIAGTWGYLDPECFQTYQLTAKSDVYSFGVLLVELLTAKKSVLRLSRSQKYTLLATHFLSAMKENRLLQVLDDQVRNVGHESQVTAIAQLAKRCLEVKGEERPTMKEVMVELLGLRGSQYHPRVNNNIEEVESLLGERAETLEMTQPTTPKGKGKKKPETEGIGVGKETDESLRTWIHENALLDHIERSSVRVDRKKIKSFRDSFDSAFDCVGRESCSTSQLDIESTKDTPSSQQKRVVEKGRHSKKFKPTAKKLDYSDEPVQVDSTTTSLRPSATFSHPVSPFVDDVLNTPFNTPPEMSIVVHTPMLDINRRIWQIKRLHRERKIPRYFEEYAHLLVQSEYVLTESEITLLEGFLGFYKTKLDELEIYCTMVAPKDLKNALDLETWLDTNLMYWWFDILKDRYPDVIFYDSSICSWWQENNIKALEDNVWGKDGIKVWEAKQKRLLVFIIWHEAHFTLLVGNTQERRWDFYNSMKSDRSSLTACKEFIDFLGKQFSNYGWYDAHIWPLLVKTEIPYQENGNDCGVFALAFADHCASGRPINFTQVDIPYWRSKIVVDIYKRSWEINSHRLPINPFLS